MPMSSAERQRRYIERLKAKADDQTVPTRRQLYDLQRALRAAEARIEKLERQVDRHRAELKGARNRGDKWYAEYRSCLRVLEAERRPKPSLAEVLAPFNREPGPPLPEIVAKLVAMLGSPHEAESRAALGRLRDVLDKANLNMSDVASRLEAGVH